MTSPVTAAAPPPARPAGDAPAGSDSAEPFASALDGALTRAGVDAAGRDGSRPGPEQDDVADGGAGEEATAEAAQGTGVAPDAAVATAPAGLVAALWARLTGTPRTDGPGADGTPSAGPHATGHVHAGTGPPGLARGLRGQLPSHVADGVPAGGARKDGAATPGAPAAPLPSAAPAAPTTGPVLPPPAAAPDASAVLAAVGVRVVASVPAAPVPGVPTTGGLGPAAPAVAPAAPATGEAPAPVAVPPVPPVAVPPVAEVPSVRAADGDPAGGALADDSPGESSTVAATAPAPAASTAAPAPRAEATGPAVPQPVAGQLARPVAVLRGGPDGTHSLTVVLTPENLGPVEVSVTLSEGTVELTLRGAHDHGRAALLEALPELRRDLEAAGLTCSRVDVERGGRDGAGSQSSAQQFGGRDAGGGRGQQHDRGEGARPWHRPADEGEGHPARIRTASGLDVRV